MTEDWAIPYIQEVIKQTKLNPTQLAKRAGVSSSTLTRPLNGPDHKFKVSRTTLEKLRDATGVPFPGESSTNTSPDIPVESRAVMVPVYDIAASAGPGTYVDYEIQVAQMSLPRGYLKSLTSTPPEQLAIISVKGDSMSPTLNDGDIVLVDSAKTNSGFDGLFVINFDGTLHVKRLTRGSRPGMVRILSDNAQFYPPVEAKVDEINVVGRVRWAAGKM